MLNSVCPEGQGTCQRAEERHGITKSVPPVHSRHVASTRKTESPPSQPERPSPTHPRTLPHWLSTRMSSAHHMETTRTASRNSSPAVLRTGLTRPPLSQAVCRDSHTTAAQRPLRWALLAPADRKGEMKRPAAGQPADTGPEDSESHPSHPQHLRTTLALPGISL